MAGRYRTVAKALIGLVAAQVALQAGGPDLLSPIKKIVSEGPLTLDGPGGNLSLPANTASNMTLGALCMDTSSGTSSLGVKPLTGIYGIVPNSTPSQHGAAFFWTVLFFWLSSLLVKYWQHLLPKVATWVLRQYYRQYHPIAVPCLLRWYLDIEYVKPREYGTSLRSNDMDPKVGPALEKLFNVTNHTSPTGIFSRRPVTPMPTVQIAQPAYYVSDLSDITSLGLAKMFNVEDHDETYLGLEMLFNPAAHVLPLPLPVNTTVFRPFDENDRTYLGVSRLFDATNTLPGGINVGDPPEVDPTEPSSTVLDIHEPKSVRRYMYIFSAQKRGLAVVIRQHILQYEREKEYLLTFVVVVIVVLGRLFSDILSQLQTQMADLQAKTNETSQDLTKLRSSKTADEDLIKRLTKDLDNATGRLLSTDERYQQFKKNARHVMGENARIQGYFNEMTFEIFLQETAKLQLQADNASLRSKLSGSQYQKMSDTITGLRKNLITVKENREEGDEMWQELYDKKVAHCKALAKKCGVEYTDEYSDEDDDEEEKSSAETTVKGENNGNEQPNVGELQKDLAAKDGRIADLEQKLNEEKAYVEAEKIARAGDTMAAEKTKADAVEKARADAVLGAENEKADAVKKVRANVVKAAEKATTEAVKKAREDVITVAKKMKADAVSKARAEATEEGNNRNEELRKKWRKQIEDRLDEKDKEIEALKAKQDTTANQGNVNELTGETYLKGLTEAAAQANPTCPNINHLLEIEVAKLRQEVKDIQLDLANEMVRHKNTKLELDETRNWLEQAEAQLDGTKPNRPTTSVEKPTTDVPVAPDSAYNSDREVTTLDPVDEVPPSSGNTSFVAKTKQPEENDMDVDDSYTNISGKPQSSARVEVPVAKANAGQSDSPTLPDGASATQGIVFTKETPINPAALMFKSRNKGKRRSAAKPKFMTGSSPLAAQTLSTEPVSPPFHSKITTNGAVFPGVADLGGTENSPKLSFPVAQSTEAFKAEPVVRKESEESPAGAPVEPVSNALASSFPTSAHAAYVSGFCLETFGVSGTLFLINTGCTLSAEAFTVVVGTGKPNVPQLFQGLPSNAASAAKSPTDAASPVVPSHLPEADASKLSPSAAFEPKPAPAGATIHHLPRLNTPFYTPPHSPSAFSPFSSPPTSRPQSGPTQPSQPIPSFSSPSSSATPAWTPPASSFSPKRPMNGSEVSDSPFKDASRLADIYSAVANTSPAGAPLYHAQTGGSRNPQPMAGSPKPSPSQPNRQALPGLFTPYIPPPKPSGTSPTAAALPTRPQSGPTQPTRPIALPRINKPKDDDYIWLLEHEDSD
ncbi:MAG: hypothetical protein Q9218_003254 [Villophora microphyllina]